ncbi:hypothetical protein T03_5388 [Trichinella britovi]|uniref:Uncharacterized protein n=1 Tax=Trichinella britovi TaxID=45882 RepID=A0A0V1CTY1_TRIBR|nr:hypothetical protein T03_5388 [Trichinella britovi]
MGFEILNVGTSGQVEALFQYFQRERLPATKIPLWNIHGVAVRTISVLLLIIIVVVGCCLLLIIGCCCNIILYTIYLPNSEALVAKSGNVFV